MASTILEMRGITKTFPGVKALSNVNLSVDDGEIHAIVGENGAGKSTLMKVVAGDHRPDEGELFVDGEPVRFTGVADALRRGIVLIHQELNLADNLDVAANIFLGREKLRGGLIDTKRLRQEARRHLEAVGLEADPATLVSAQTIGHQQLVEIAKALSVNARVLIMDEPTSSLSSHEAENLFKVIRDLRTRGVSIVYI